MYSVCVLYEVKVSEHFFSNNNNNNNNCEYNIIYILT